MRLQQNRVYTMTALQSKDDLQSLLSETCNAIRRAICTPNRQITTDTRGISNAIALLEFTSSFQKSVNEVDPTWIPKGAIERVLRDCCNERYDTDDIEAIFFQHAGRKRCVTC
jgi:hypothetical protein